MRDNSVHITPYRIAIVTLNSHNARPCERALENMCVDYPGLEVDILRLLRGQTIQVSLPKQNRRLSRPI